MGALQLIQISVYFSFNVLLEVPHWSAQHKLEEVVKEVGTTKIKGLAKHNEVKGL
jgi:hypothetical protein